MEESAQKDFEQACLNQGIKHSIEINMKTCRADEPAAVALKRPCMIQRNLLAALLTSLKSNADKFTQPLYSKKIFLGEKDIEGRGLVKTFKFDMVSPLDWAIYKNATESQQLLEAFFKNNIERICNLFAARENQENIKESLNNAQDIIFVDLLPNKPHKKSKKNN